MRKGKKKKKKIRKFGLKERAGKGKWGKIRDSKVSTIQKLFK